MPKPTSAAETAAVKVVVITLDRHIAGAVQRARQQLADELPGLQLAFHAATDWNDDPTALSRCKDDIADGDIVFANMLFMEDHIQAVLPALKARQESVRRDGRGPFRGRSHPPNPDSAASVWMPPKKDRFGPAQEAPGKQKESTRAAAPTR